MATLFKRVGFIVQESSYLWRLEERGGEREKEQCRSLSKTSALTRIAIGSPIQRLFMTMKPFTIHARTHLIALRPGCAYARNCASLRSHSLFMHAIAVKHGVQLVDVDYFQMRPLTFYEDLPPGRPFVRLSFAVIFRERMKNRHASRF